ncbi:MAG: septum formation protein Maf [Clostridiales bacterium]|nr:septum formation protein Maf [Clostridiales bacterium]
MKRIVLASASPRRREYLSLLGYDYTCMAADVDESGVRAESPAALSMALAALKARAVAKEAGENTIVIGADTIVVLCDAVLGKPKDDADAHRMLKMLSGKAHEVYTGLCVIDTLTGTEVRDYRCTKVHMQEISDEERTAYVASGESRDKAGAYAIQGGASKFITHIEGCYFNVLGLPINALYEILKPMVQE